jgi:hypothetical protein
MGSQRAKATNGIVARARAQGPPVTRDAARSFMVGDGEPVVRGSCATIARFSTTQTWRLYRQLVSEKAC